MKVILWILFLCFFIFGVYSYVRNPAWITDPEHIAAFGLGMAWGLILGRIL